MPATAPSLPLAPHPRPGPMRTEGFHHVGFVSGDADRTVRFYGELLGLTRLDPKGIRSLQLPDPAADAAGGSHHPGLLFGDGKGSPGSLVAFRIAPGLPRGRWGVGGIHHLALSVGDRDALLRWKRRLSDAGVPAQGPIDRGYFTSLYFQDPDGHILELATEGPGYAIDEPADALGERYVTPPAERLRGHRDEAAIAAAIHPEPVPQITPGMHIGAIHHVTGITDDLAAFHDFLAVALGLRLVKQTANQDDGRTAHLLWARYDGIQVAPASALTLFGWPGSDYRARPGVGQASHLAFRAPDSETVGLWREHLREAGIPVRSVGDPPLALYFQSPDGLEVGVTVDSLPDLRGE